MEQLISWIAISKIYREKELKSFVLGNILLILMENRGIVDNIVQLMSSSDLWKAAAELFESSIISSIIYISCLFDSILQGRLKDKVIWPIKGLPGNTIFLDIDKTIKMSVFLSKQQEKFMRSYIPKSILARTKRNAKKSRTNTGTRYIKNMKVKHKSIWRSVIFCCLET